VANDATATEVRLLREETKSGFKEVKDRLDTANGKLADHGERLATVESTMVTTKDCETARGSKARIVWSIVGPVISGAVLVALLNALSSGG